MNNEIKIFPALVDDILIVPLSSAENEFLPPPYSTRGAVLALNALTGEIRWRFETTPEPFAPGGGISSGISFDPQRKLLFVGTGQNYQATPPYSPFTNSILALRYDTTNPNGSLVWHRQFSFGDIFNITSTGSVTNFDVLATPIVANVKKRCSKHRFSKLQLLLVADMRGIAYGLDRETGEIRWSTVLMRMDMVNSIKTFNGHHAYAKGIFYVAGMRPLNDNQPINPFLLGATDSETDLFALDASSGKVIWKSEKIPGGTVVGLAVANGILYLSTSIGRISAFNAKNGNYLFLTQLSEPNIQDNIIATSLTVAEGTLFFATGFGAPPHNLAVRAWRPNSFS